MNIRAKPWKKTEAPKMVLAIRLQAMGDLIITLPYLNHLKQQLPLGAELDLLTRREVEEIPKNINLFNRVYSIGGGRSRTKQLLHGTALLPAMWKRRYDVVIDLQNNEVSRWMKKMLIPEAWSEFDRFSPLAAGERTRKTIEAAGLTPSIADYSFNIKNEEAAMHLLRNNGWSGSTELVVLNPAGAFSSRNWPLEYYAAFSNRWLSQFPNTQFLIMGLDRIAAKAGFLQELLGDKIINLVNRTTMAEAFALVQKAKLVLSEDSGLMHAAWVSGIPTIAMFGSTRSDWSAPLGNHSLLLDSSDLECGNCMLETCRFGDVHCLTRYSPEFIFEKALTLI